METPTPPPHRWTIAVFVLALAVTFAGGVWSLTLSPLEERATSPAPASPLPAEQVAATASDRLHVGTLVSGHGSVIANGAGSTWVVDRGTLSTIRSGVATVVAHGTWGADAILAPANDGSMWLASGRFLWPVSSWGTVGERLAPSVGAISAVLAADSRTWVAGANGTVAWIDPWTGNTIQSYYLGHGSYQLAAASDYVFVATSDPTAAPIVRLDPSMGATVPVPGAAPGPMAAAQGRLWWGTASGLRCVVAATLRRCGHVDVEQPTFLAGHGRALWVVFAGTQGAEIALFDPKHGRPVAGPITLPGPDAASIAVGGTTAWVGLQDTDAVAQVTRR